MALAARRCSALVASAPRSSRHRRAEALLPTKPQVTTDYPASSTPWAAPARPPRLDALPGPVSLGPSTDAVAGLAGGKGGAADDVAAADTTNAVSIGASRERAPGGLAVYNEDEDNLPPLKYEEGPVGAAQKGVSAIVIAFGAVAFGACAWGVSQALFPGASSSQSIYSEALEKARSHARTSTPSVPRRVSVFLVARRCPLAGPLFQSHAVLFF